MFNERKTGESMTNLLSLDTSELVNFSKISHLAPSYTI